MVAALIMKKIWVLCQIDDILDTDFLKHTWVFLRIVILVNEEESWDFF